MDIQPVLVQAQLVEVTDVLPWDRLPDESSLHYAWFLAYRDIGHARSVNAACVRYNRPGEAAQGQARLSANGTWYDASKRHDWPERARSWDKHLQRNHDVILKQRLNDARLNLAQTAQVIARDLAGEWERIQEQEITKGQVVSATKLTAQTIKSLQPEKSSVNVSILLDQLPPGIQAELAALLTE